MSFFDNEEAHTVVLALGSPCGIPRREFAGGEIPQGKGRGGRATPQGLPSPPPMDTCKGTGARLDYRERAGSDPVTRLRRKPRACPWMNAGQGNPP